MDMDMSEPKLDRTYEPKLLIQNKILHRDPIRFIVEPLR